MISHSQSNNESTPWPIASDVLWVVAGDMYHPNFQPFRVILQEWLLSGKHRLEMKLGYSNLLWELLANFLMLYSNNMVSTVTVSYLPTRQVVLILTRWESSPPKQ